MLQARGNVLSSQRTTRVCDKWIPRVVRCKAAETTETSLVKPGLVELGKSGLMVPPIGIGSWSWGDRSGYWGYGKEYGREENRLSYEALMSAGLGFIDTAEVYGFGKSEEYLGEFMAATRAAGGANPAVATKFAPQPWRQTADSVPTALKASLARMQVAQTDLYMIHWPGFILNAFSNDAYVEGLAQCLEAGLTKAVGVSNFSGARVRSVSKTLKERGHVLASNQVQYSLLYRAPEKTGVFEACKENGTTLVAFSPLTQGVLSGKYAVGGAKPSGPRGFIQNDDRLRKSEPLLVALKAVAEERGKSMSQVAINWCICKGALPIPGAKNPKQVEDIAGAMGWLLTEGEVLELEKASDRCPSWLGPPYEQW